MTPNYISVPPLRVTAFKFNNLEPGECSYEMGNVLYSMSRYWPI